MSERYCLPGFTNAADQQPEDGAIVLVMMRNWSAPRVLQFDDAFRGAGFPAFLDGRAGRWFWWPEQMCWQSIDEGEPVPKPTEADYWGEPALCAA